MIRVVTGLLLLIATQSVVACGLDAASRIVLQDETRLDYRIKNQSIEISEYFTLEILFCRNDKILEVGHLVLDATMPDHGHGMNYLPEISKFRDGHFEASGLLFHMPGTWKVRLDFEIAGQGRQADFIVTL